MKRNEENALDSHYSALYKKAFSYNCVIILKLWPGYDKKLLTVAAPYIVYERNYAL